MISVLPPVESGGWVWQVGGPPRGWMHAGDVSILNNPCSEGYFFEISSSEASILAHPSRCLAGHLASTVGAVASPGFAP